MNYLHEVVQEIVRIPIREDAVVRNKAIYLALGVLPDGTRDILGLWIENTEGAKFWMKVFNDLKTRGVVDILIAVTDGLKGIGETLGAVFPATTLQTCIVHLIRNSLDYASWKDRKLLAAALKLVYTATSAETAAQALDEFERGPWGQKYPTVTACWCRAWDRVIPFFAFPPAVWRVVYTTDEFDKPLLGHHPLEGRLGSDFGFVCQLATKRTYARSTSWAAARSRSRTSLTLYSAAGPRCPFLAGKPARSSSSRRFLAVKAGRPHAKSS